MKTNKKQTHSVIDGHYSLSVSNRRRIVILGKTGTGKSSVANTIFGEKLFRISHTANSETSECRAETKPVNGRDITLIDTPGLFDTDRSEEELKSEIVKCITEFAPGPHAFLIVFEAGRFTEQEQAVITKINQYFSEEVFKYAIVLFTHGDQLPEGQTIEDCVRDNKLVSDLVKKCGGRCHVIDNKYWKDNQQDEYRSNQFQVKELLNTIEKMIEANEGSCYTNEMLQAVEAMIRQEEEHIRQSSGNMSEKEITEKAKDRVSNRLLINLTGIATGALLGALFGVIVMVKVVLLALEAVLTLAKTVETLAAGTDATKDVVAALIKAAAAEETDAAKEGAASTKAALQITATAVVAKAGIAVKSAIALTVVCAAVGGVAGYITAQEADTPSEAAEKTFEAVKSTTNSIVDLTKSWLRK
ncbi:GTPase IMAP family member 7-like [Lycodopsis pacificus]